MRTRTERLGAVLIVFGIGLLAATVIAVLTGRAYAQITTREADMLQQQINDVRRDFTRFSDHQVDFNIITAQRQASLEAEHRALLWLLGGNVGASLLSAGLSLLNRSSLRKLVVNGK